jgi:hypothetical protein
MATIVLRTPVRVKAAGATCGYGPRVDPHEVAAVALALDDVRESTVRGRRTWTVRGRLVAHPETFAVTPRMEAHQKM